LIFSVFSIFAVKMKQISILSKSRAYGFDPPVIAYKITPVFGAVDHLYNNASGQCTETRYICSAQITPPARTLLDS
jgi:hypothetical protein